MKFLLALSLVLATAMAKNSYVVVAPAKIRANMDLSVSVNILSAPSDVTVKASLNHGSTEVASATGVFTPGTPGKLTIKVPSTLSSGSHELKVVGSGGLDFTDHKYLSVNNKQFSMFIQTDKGIYKPGDTVNFRTFAIYPDLKAYTAPMDIAVFDGQGNKIKQWLQQTPVDGVVSKSFKLSSQPVLGDWKVQMKTLTETEEKIFEVAEYVLPKFEVQVDMPSYAMTSDNDVTFTVKAKYTYGKPVSGTADVSAKLHYSYQTYQTSTSAAVYSTSVAMDGEVRITVPMATLKAVTSNLDNQVLSVVANVSESLTGNVMTAEGSVTLYDLGFKLDFLKSNPDTFKPGLEYTAYLKVAQQDGLPVSATTSPVTVETAVTVQDKVGTTPSYWYYEPPTHVVQMPKMDISVPNNGLVAIPVDIPSDAYKVTVTATFRGVRKQLSLKKSHSPSDSYIQLFLRSTGAISAGSSINFEVKATQPVESLVYQVLSRGAIVATGTVPGHQQQGVSFALTSSAAMAPNARIVVYYVRQDGEIVTDSISFDIDGAFKNKVTVDINKAEAEPGNNVTVFVKADPNSKAYLLAIDQSLLLLRGGNDVSADDVYSELKAYDTIKENSGDDIIRPFFGGGGMAPMEPFRRRRKRMAWWPYPVYYGGSDATKIFNNAGVIVITDALVYQHQEPILLRRTMFMAMASKSMAFSASVDVSGLSEPTRVRTNFVETWLYETLTTCANGLASVESIVPDTITSWVASAFSFNDQSGLGVAPNQAHLKVFRPFFVSLNLPYSVTRGEQLALQAIVFNYLPDDAQVRVTLQKSDAFFNIFVDSTGVEGMRQVDAVQDILVKAGEAKSVYFPIVPADLGKINVEVHAQAPRAADAVRRQLLVEAEGVPKEFSIPVLVELTNHVTDFTKTVKLQLPANTVDGSELLRVSVVGDLMGPSVAGLDSLLRMPTGCGEQTMLSLAPDVYIVDYLTAVQQLEGDIAQKAISFMESGYQRELTYKHTDHSFSAFGNSDDSGSMWLTAFVAKVFHQAKSYIFVDDDVIIRAVVWMLNKQNSDGSFPEPGRVIHKNMQGQASSGTALSLFVFISIMENKDLLTTGAYTTKFENARTKALSYLESQIANEDDLYTLAMASYAFQLAGSSQTQAVLDKLESRATIIDGTRFWEYPSTPKPTSPTVWYPPHQSTAVNVEMTSYILLTYAIRKDMIMGKNILQWVAQQRNPNGGFCSTQDTVVALNAMSEFARLVYSDNFQVQLTAELNATSSFQYSVDQSNALVLQSKETKNVPTDVRISAKGSGVILAELAVFFNVESEIEETTFDLKVKLVDETLSQLSIQACVSWLGEGSASGMAVIEIGIPSGFETDPESISRHSLLKKIEYANKKVILYFDEINTKEMCVDLTVVRTGLVAKSQPAPVRVYDYYEPRNQMTTFYQSQKLKDASYCDVCVDCENCATRRR